MPNYSASNYSAANILAGLRAYYGDDAEALHPFVYGRGEVPAGVGKRREEYAARRREVSRDFHLYDYLLG